MKKHIYIFSFFFSFFYLTCELQGKTNVNTDFPSTKITAEDTIYENISITICRSDLPYFYANKLFSEGGDYEIALKTSEGKDSIIRFQLVVLNAPVQPGNIKGDSIINQLGHYMYKIDPVEDAEEYTWQISNLQWIISKSYKKDSTKIFIPTGGSGVLTVTAKNQCGISPARQFLIQSTLDIDNFVNTDKLTLYPNPTKDFITLDFLSTLKGINELYLYDTDGKLLIKTTLKNQSTTLNLSELSVGFYFIKISLDNTSTRIYKIHKSQ